MARYKINASIDYGIPIIRQCDAKRAGLSRYFSGNLCKYGHVCEKRTIDASCMMCSRKLNAKPFGPPIPPEYYGIPFIRRCDAERAGLTRYFTGKLCKHGHVCERMVWNSTCVMCLKEKSKPFIKAWWSKKYTTDPSFRLACNLRNRLWHIIHRLKIKKGSAVKDLGCSLIFLKQYLEEQFTDEMNWENHGSVWSIDHKKPLARFDLTDQKQFLEACHYTNLQPLLVLDNKGKHTSSMEEWLLRKEKKTIAK